jgi:hypothetical protein
MNIIENLSRHFSSTKLKWNKELCDIADLLGLIFYRARMQSHYDVVNSAFPVMLKVLKSQQAKAKALPSVTPSQFTSLMGLHSEANLALLKGISKACSEYTNVAAKKLLKDAGELKPFARAPNPDEIMKIGILLADFCNGPLVHMYYETICTWLKDPLLKVVLIAVGNVDRDYDLVQKLIVAVNAFGKLLEFPVINDANRADHRRRCAQEASGRGDIRRS